MHRASGSPSGQVPQRQSSATAIRRGLLCATAGSTGTHRGMSSSAAAADKPVEGGADGEGAGGSSKMAKDHQKAAAALDAITDHVRSGRRGASTVCCILDRLCARY
jgi:hypothetical protein